MKVLRNLPILLDTEGNSRELSPREVDALAKHGDEYAENFNIEGPTGERY